MKQYLLAFLCFYSSINIFAQTHKLPVQGKLVENNAPVNGTRDFDFSITSLNWTQSKPGIQVTQGLYTVELDVPANLFASQNSHDLKIDVDGVNITTVKIYAPVESDPTVPAAIKDGISWTEVSGKPASLDLDSTNEVQTLTVTGTTLSISGGNTVQLPAGGGSNQFDTLVVGPVKLEAVVGPAVESNTGAEFKSSVTQTFIAEQTGNLISVEVYCANSQGAAIFFRIKSTNSGQEIASNSFPSSAFGANLGFKTFVPTQNPATLTQFQEYILEITVQGGSYLFGYDENDPYKFGASDIISGGLADLTFKINLEMPVGPSMRIDSNGYVGIGTANPTSKLTVNGRIEDQTGFLMPVGSILAYAGAAPNPPKGWLFCDGTPISRVQYADLFYVLGTVWGAGDGSTTFHLPDLRGEFLRGWDGNTNNDPDHNSRHNKYTGGTSIGVGSYQENQFQDHNHKVNTQAGQSGIGPPNDVIRGNGIGNNIIETTTFSGGAETRPRNAAVMYIIKY